MDADRSVRDDSHSKGGQRIAADSTPTGRKKIDVSPVGSRGLARFSAGAQTREEDVSVYYDKDSRTWYLRYRAEGQHRAVRIGKKGDRLSSRKDVERSPEYQAVVSRLNGGHSPKEAQLLRLAHECGLDTGIISRLLLDKQQLEVLLSMFVTDTFLPHIEKQLKRKRCGSTEESGNGTASLTSSVGCLCPAWSRSTYFVAWKRSRSTCLRERFNT